MRNYIIFYFSFLLLISCTSEEKGEEKILPESSGALGEVLVVQDSSIWKSGVGLSIKKVLKKAHPLMVNPEPYFNTAYLPMTHFGGFLLEHRFILLPITKYQAETNRVLRHLVPQSKLASIGKEEPLFLRFNDVYAKNQTILVIISLEEYFLEKYFRENAEGVRDVIEREVVASYGADLLSQDRDANLNTRLKEKFNADFLIPDTYKLAMESDDFIWLRNISEGADLSLVIYQKTYEGEMDFETDTLLGIKDELGSKFLKGSVNGSYVRTERSANVITAIEKADNEVFKKYLRGLWRMENEVMGGPFISCAIKSPKNQNLYYVEGFVKAPGQEKLNYIRKLESIIRTFEPIQQ